MIEQTASGNGAMAALFHTGRLECAVPEQRRCASSPGAGRPGGPRQMADHTIANPPLT